MNSMGQAASAEGNEQTRFQVVTFQEPNYSEWSLWFVEKGGMILSLKEEWKYLQEHWLLLR